MNVRWDFSDGCERRGPTDRVAGCVERIRTLRTAPTMRPALQTRGFTLVELVITLAVASTILAIGVPAVSGLTSRMRANSALADATSSLALARIEAVSRNRVVELCPSGDGTRCSGGQDWSSGWIVFLDGDGDGQPSSGDIVSRIEAVPRGLSLRSTVGRERIRFQSTGWASGTNLTLNLCAGPTARARVIVNNAGRVRVERDRADCPRA
ncbi:GspH/FimT family pseudopilin [Cognatilysobacter lacus]|uniref:Type II secretion system protein H n=1 Tax=Cognatilysobacter lacus TaxID=1643323 RepID=A0A5D8ZAJ3_9GAMM|nr:GspH/FimT family pseudopilin [Lysobacter lacus]TZF91831.1 prepilin-type N-terminal cleavage/methylation domain-containing protein [Lysobacter lacus]